MHFKETMLPYWVIKFYNMKNEKVGRMTIVRKSYALTWCIIISSKHHDKIPLKKDNYNTDGQTHQSLKEKKVLKSINQPADSKKRKCVFNLAR